MRFPRRTAHLPDDARAGLDLARGERVLSAACQRDGEWVAADHVTRHPAPTRPWSVAATQPPPRSPPALSTRSPRARSSAARASSGRRGVRRGKRMIEEAYGDGARRAQLVVR